jgi:membrane-associated phospholipid phosphatase
VSSAAGAAVTFLVVVTHQVVVDGPLAALDRRLDEALRPVGARHGWLDLLALPAQRAVAVTGALVVCVLIARRQRSWRPVAVLVVSVLSATVLAGVLKLLVARGYPYQDTVRPDAEPLAFPSGHAANAVACWGVIATFAVAAGARRWVAAAGVAAVLGALAASSMLLRTHWATDLVAGAAVGMLGVAVAVGSVGVSGPAAVAAPDERSDESVSTVGAVGG